MPRLLKHLSVLGLAIAALALAGCPSIPIPPPDPSAADMTFNVTDTGGVSAAVFTYPARSYYIDSTAYVWDQATGQGVIQRANANGSIGPTLPLPAKLGDPVIVSITTAEQQTVSTCVVLQQGQQNPNAQCP